MELDSLINLLLILAFLFISTIGRVLKSKKKKAETPQRDQPRRTLFPFLQRMRDQYEQYIEELDRQANPEKYAARSASPWDPEEDWEEAEYLPDLTGTEATAAGPSRIPKPRAVLSDPVQSPVYRLVPGGSGLRQAIIWKEILDVPVGLRESRTSARYPDPLQ
jgi:hypothetical protein